MSISSTKPINVPTPIIKLKRIRRIYPNRYKNWVFVPSGHTFTLSDSLTSGDCIIEIREDDLGNRVIRIQSKGRNKCIQ